MNSDRLEINCAMQIQKPIHEVFDAIINPKKCPIISLQLAQE